MLKPGRTIPSILLAVCLAVPAMAAAPTFTDQPAATTSGGVTTIRFAVSASTDVEVTILDAKGDEVRHLAAGVLGASADPPPPLKAGLAQTLTWDGKDDMGQAAEGGPFSVRVRAGMGVKLARFIGGDPFVFGSITSIATDDDGNLYAMSNRGQTNQNIDTLRMFAPDGAYVRTIVPFPVTTSPDRVKPFARWDAEAGCFRPINRLQTNPSMVPWVTGATIVSAATSEVVLVHGTSVYRLDTDGGNLRGPMPMWSKEAKLKNPNWNIPQLAVSPDGRYIYYANVAGTLYDTKTPDQIDANWPNGRVYRQDTRKEGADPQPFFDLPLPDWNKDKYWMPNAWNKRTAANGLDVDRQGNLYVCDLVNQQVVKVSPEGKLLATAKVPWPDYVHVNRTTGDLYVISDQPRDGRKPNVLYKVSGWGEEARIVATMQLTGRTGDASAVGTIEGKAVLWLGGGEELVCVRDAGETFEVVRTKFRPEGSGEQEFSRIAVDPVREQVYLSNGVNELYRYDGQTGAGEQLKRNGKPFQGVDLEVGYDGLLYVRTGGGYSGPLERYTVNLEPAPLESGTNVFSKYIYSRYGVGFCEKGLGVGPKGQVYVSFMYGWNQYLIAGFNPDGTPMKGKYLEGVFKPDTKAGAPAELNTAVIGPIPAESGGVRVDLQGNIYAGLRLLPKGYVPPAEFAKDPAYGSFTGSVVKFGPAGGAVLGLQDAKPAQPDAPKLEMDRKVTIENGLAAYPGIAPFSGGGYGSNGSSCVCRVARFEVDRFGRVFLPNCVSNTVIVYDNAGNKVLEFGQYGNFDSQLPGPGRAASAIATPALPLGWPTGVGVSRKAIYVCDTLNRRVVRADKTWAAEATVSAK
ncbi:MAG: hypothetical protein BIFFINMI_00706 [Phycisphaerae bacterium]|nr:hypothetical protein [Phycisphaerae bacterium]